tara:strand:- start:206 stop:361 length:156 start_codon:yes stop_codon:yes gene_type:complete
MRIYDKLKKEFDVILEYKEKGQGRESYLAFTRIPKHFRKIVKLENAEAKRA